VTPDDTLAFSQLLTQLHTVFGGNKPDQDTVNAYWSALKDLPFSTLQAVAQQHLRYGKFFPKPMELRPREDRAPRMTESDSEALKAAQEQRNRDLDWERVLDPISFALRYNEGFSLRRLGELREGDPDYAAALREYRYWLDMKTQPIEVQRRALPTFAQEERMTRAQRIERMEYIRAQRARGIKANQLVFPQESSQNTLPDERW
jgi:hypothetical protein